METLTTIYHQILGLGGSAKKSQRVYRQVQNLALVCIVALRKGHYELWRQADDGEEDGEDESPDAFPPQLPPP